ncbi:MAG TPA: Smr/MutS family protein, partial [Nitrospirota bacterium]
EGVRKIDRSGTRLSSQTRQQSAAHTDSNAEKDERDFLQAMKKLGTNFHDHAEEPEAEEEGRCSQSSRLRQLKHGTIRISQELDLHGFLKDEALTQLGRFIAHAFNRGQNAVLVITGKGLNSPEGPVLQGAVAEWLRQKGKGMVAEFSAAPRGLGGSGAFVVFLKKK